MPSFLAALTLISPLVAAAFSPPLWPHPYKTLRGGPRSARFRVPAPRRAAPPRASTVSTAPWCTPGQACWPAAADWAALNTTVSGALISVAPPLAPCFGSFPGVPYDQATCSSNVGNFTNSYWRASQPGANQEPNWEEGADGSNCYDAAKPCTLGNIPPYAVAVARDGDVSAALDFARKHNLQVVVKATGHEYQGRSAGANALLVWVKSLAGVTVDPHFAACPGDAPRPALTARPGSSWGEAYRAADAAGVVVVGGSEISVSACGGYTLGGGHSWTGPTYGMAVDNVLRFKAVLANGSAVTASACENADLFWALRGGGGGSFAVVTECSYAAHPVPAQGAAGAFITVELLQGNTSYAVLMDGFLASIPMLSDAVANGAGVVAGGYFIPDLSAPEGTHEHMSFLLSFNGTVDQANKALAPLSAWVATVPQYLTVIGAQVLPFPSLMAFHESFDNSSEPTGDAVTLTSRLVPMDLLLDNTTRLNIALGLTAFTYTVGGMTGMLVTGGAVAQADPDSSATSINPAWRSAGAHIAFGAGWALNTSLAEVAGIFQGVSELTDAYLRATCDTPGGRGPAAYWSESDYLESDWQTAFWGKNYPRLQEIKAAVDPGNAFTCHHCVELPATAGGS